MPSGSWREVAQNSTQLESTVFLGSDLSTDCSLSALQIIELYGMRFKIEVSFKQAIYTIGTYSYHFWMAAMIPIPRRSGNQHLHRKPRAYRDQIRC